MIVFNPKTTNRIYSNDKFKELEGFLSPEIARVTLAEFLFNNLGFTVELLFNLKIYPFQEIILRSWFDHNFCLNIWGRGGSKTVDYEGDTYVLEKTKGLILLHDLLPNIDFSQGDRWVDINPIQMWNGKNWTDVSKLYIQPKKSCLKIKTKRGFTLVGSTNHLVKGINNINQNCNIVWKKYNELKVGDSICISRSTPEWSNINNNESYLIGLLLGDGCLSVTSPGFTLVSGDDQILDYCVLRGAKLSNKQKTTAKVARFSKQYSESLISTFNLKRGLSYTKEIPSVILQDKECLKACIQGLFDTDGYISTKRLKIGYTSVSYKMAKQVHLALSLFGVVSSLLEHKTKSPFGRCYTINITGKDCQIFRDQIGFRLIRKQSLLNNHLINNIFNSNLDIIPGAKDKLKKIRSTIYLPKILSNEWRDNLKCGNKQHNLTYSSLEENVAFFEKAGVIERDLADLKEIQKENFFFDEIVEITPIDTNCLDFNIPNGEMYWSNGFINHNSWLCAVFCCLYPIFYPRTRIVLASNAFRSTRRLIQQIERFINAKGADLLRQCYYEKKGRLEFVRRADEMTLDINEGQIIAIPLNEKVRGTRGDILIVDEFLMVPEDIYKSVLMPFLTARNDIQEQLENKELRDSLLIPDDLSKEDLALVTSTKKIIGLTSASYDFEFVYRLYLNWIQKASKPPIGSSYFVSRIGYQALPESLIDKEIVEEAKSGGENTASFQREYMAIFSSSSDGYFNIKKLHDNTIRDGDLPCVQLKGSKDAKYILAIDPSFSDATTSDFFAMGVYLLNSDNRSITLVHTYARTGDKSELKDHIRYLYYLISCFNIVMIIGDFGGRSFNFIKACNESNYFVERNINLDFFEGNFDDEDYMGQLKVARNSYNLSKRKICYTQIYQRSEWIRKANEHLKTQIESGKVHFASRLTGHEQMFKNAVETEIPVLFKDNDDFQRSILDFIADQDDLIEQTKRQLALIEPKVTSTGVMQFDLPQHLRQSKSPSKARRDCYSCMVMGSWAARCFYDLTMLEDEPISYTFDPILI